MQDVSLLYKRAMKQQIRTQGYINIVFGVVDVTAANDMTASDSGHAVISEPQKIARYELQQPYATAEKGRLKLDGKQYIASRNVNNLLYQGFVGDRVSMDLITWGQIKALTYAQARTVKISEMRTLFPNETFKVGFTQPTFLILSFSKLHSTKGLMLTFDNILDIYPRRIKLTLSANGIVIEQSEYEVDRAIFTIEDDFLNFDRIKIEWLETHERFQRARLTHIVFGIGLNFSNTEYLSRVRNASQSLDIDPIMRRLPTNTFSFAISNLDKRYDIDNPAGMWQFIATKSPVTVEYGIETAEPITWGEAKQLTYGEVKTVIIFDIITLLERPAPEEKYIEFVNGGEYVLNAMPIVDNLQVTFNCTDILAGLENIYFKGLNYLSGISLYDMAVNVLEDAGLTNQQYSIDSGLRAITTTAFMPKQSHKDCLKMIAQAARCIVYTDREGIVHIEPNVAESSNILIGDASGDSRMYGNATIEKSPQLSNIETNIYNYILSENVTELNKSTIVAVNAYIVYFDNAENVTHQTTGTISNMRIYGGAATFTCLMSGELIFSGRKIDTLNTAINYAVSDTGDSETISNPLIINRQMAESVSKWYSDYLQNRNTYYFEYRGNPEYETNDLINIRSNFSEQLPIRVLKHDIRFNGGLRGNMITKRMES